MAAIVAFFVLFASALPTITTAQHLDVSPNGWCRIDIKYPQISGITPASLETTINAGLRKRFLEYAESRHPYQAYFSTSIAHPSMDDCDRRIEALNASSERRGLQSKGSHLTYRYDARYSVAFEDASLVSILGSGLEYFAHQPYPNTYWWAANIDMRTGRFLSFDDIFRTDEVHRKRLDDLIYEGLRRDWDHSTPEIATTFKSDMDARSELQPLVCPGGVRFLGIFSQHRIAAVTTFVDAHDLIASGVMKDPLAIDVIRSKRGSEARCGTWSPSDD